MIKKEITEKDKKQAGCITAIIMILIAVFCWIIWGPDNLPDYTVRLTKIGTNNNGNIEIVIPSDIKDSQIQEIAQKEAKRCKAQRHVFVFFYTQDNYDCFATSHSNENYKVKRLKQYK